MTEAEFLKIVQEEAISYILMKEAVYISAGLKKHEVFYTFKDSNDLLADFATWVMSRRTK